MKTKLRNLFVVGLAAASFATAVPGSAQATHQIGHFLGGVAVGALIGGAIAQQPRYVAPAPVYAPQPRICYQRQQICDAYTGCRWQRVQYYC